MPYLLDGNNLVGSARRTSQPSEEDRAALIREIAGRLRRTKARAVLFFDGSGGGASSLGSLSVRYSGTSSADDAIVGAIESSRTPHEHVVVTGDRGLACRARDAGAGVLAPDVFWQSFGASRPPGEKKDTAVDVEEWMNYFADPKNRER